MTNLVGIVLLVGLVIAAAITVVLIGTAALGAVNDQTQDDTAQKSMREMSGRLGGIADSSVESTTSFTFSDGVAESTHFYSDQANFTVAIENSTAGCSESIRRDLGTVVYEKSDGTDVAYQGGGVWRQAGNDTFVVEPAGLDFDGTTIDFNIVNISDVSSITSGSELVASTDVAESRRGAQEMMQELDQCWTGPNTSLPVNVNVSITSEYAGGWETYAREYMSVSPSSSNFSVDRVSPNTVNLTFLNVGATTQSNASAGGGGNGTSGSTAPPPYQPSGDEMNVTNSSGQAQLELLNLEVGEEANVTIKEGRRPLDVMFVLDQSGSMRTCFGSYCSGSDPSGERVDASQAFIGTLNDSMDQAGAVGFDDDAWTMHGLSSNFASVNSSMSAEALGQTAIGGGIEEGLDNVPADPDRNQIMVVLSDGENTAENNRETEAAADQAAAQNVTLYTVGLGDNADEDLLEDVADRTGGDYYHVDNSHDLVDTFKKIANKSKTESRPVINRTSTTVSAKQGAATSGLWGDSNVNDPSEFYQGNTGKKTRSFNLSSGHLSFVLTVEQCNDWSVVNGSSVSKGSTTYEQLECTNPGGSITQIGSSDSSYTLHQDGEPVALSVGSRWWTSDPSDSLGSYESGSSFALTNQSAIVAVDIDTGEYEGYALLHVTVPPTSGSSGSSSGSVPPGSSSADPIVIDFSEIGISS